MKISQFIKQYWQILIIVLAFSIRFYQLNNIPATLNPDEASIAYNAYLLLKTGRDETGKFWPIILEAFGDQKVAVYTFLTVPFLAIFGIADWVVRLPALLAGMGAIIVTGQILKNWQFNNRQRFLALFFLSIQPIFIWYHRVAFEANLALLFTLLLIKILFKLNYQPLSQELTKSAKLAEKTKSIINKKQFTLLELVLVVLFTILACFSYNVPLIILPFFAILLVFWQGIKNYKNWWLASSLILLASLICLLSQVSLSKQKSQITIFGDTTYLEAFKQQRAKYSGFQQKIFANKYLFYAGLVLENFSKQFDVNFLINNANGHPWHAIPNTGYLTLPIIVLALLAVVINFKKLITAYLNKKHTTNNYLFLLIMALTLIAILPSAITVNAPHATRTLLFFWGVIILSAQGADFLLVFLSKIWQLAKNQLGLFKNCTSNSFQNILFLLLLAIITIPSVQYLHTLFIQYPQDYLLKAPLKAGYQQVLAKATEQFPNNKIAVVDGSGFYYILTAWYQQMEPEYFFETLIKQQPNAINFRYGERVGNFHFIAQEADRSSDEKILLLWDNEQHLWQIKEY